MLNALNKLKASDVSKPLTIYAYPDTRGTKKNVVLNDLYLDGEKILRDKPFLSSSTLLPELQQRFGFQPLEHKFNRDVCYAKLKEIRAALPLDVDPTGFFNFVFQKGKPMTQKPISQFSDQELLTLQTHLSQRNLNEWLKEMEPV